MDARLEAITAVSGLFGNTIAVIVGALLAARAATAAKLAAEATHVLVNSQRTGLLRALHFLTARIAKENPSEEGPRS